MTAILYGPPDIFYCYKFIMLWNQVTNFLQDYSIDINAVRCALLDLTVWIPTNIPHKCTLVMLLTLYVGS